ncbi:exopolyphosphatase [Lacticaseibacillus pabuli]|uniref:Exopolyphosphatase n=1 Tax=Lacticaseibacillus pabuli TaxID=3025672 RepID=A0ABY7WSB2_9LACO|nr:exopolyphosphatase [Lacticaseibacillus sp. KACC 23028]WDF82298.1 exopolyphosphatase [Lacticaseibacillus sp. KACC 23028]
MADTIHGLVVIESQGISFSITDTKNLNQIEAGSYPVAIGEEVFSQHFLSAGMTAAIQDALLAIKQSFADYGVRNYEAYGGQTFFGAENGEFVRDQLMNRTGVWVHRLAIPEEAYHRSSAVVQNFPHFDQLMQEGTVLVDIGGGTVELIAFNDGRFSFSRNLKLGPLRVVEALKDVQRSADNYVDILREFIDSRILDFIRLLPERHDYKHMILMGSSLRSLGDIWPDKRAAELKLDEFSDTYRTVTHASDQFLTKKYNIDPDFIEQVLPTITLVHQLIRQLDPDAVSISNLRIIDGLEVNTALAAGSKAVKFDPTDETISSALTLSNWYHVDEAHRDATVTFALQLFDRLHKLHGLGKRERLLLQTAALITDIGSYIDTHQHGKNTEYIILSSDIVGLSGREQRIVATIARYHTSDIPQVVLSGQRNLRGSDRLVVAKLSALLRVADALDASRRQKIDAIAISTRGEKVTITATTHESLELEKWSLTQKGHFFEAVYGLPLKLKGRNTL